MSKTGEKIWNVVWAPFGFLILVVVYPVLEVASLVADKIKGRPSPRRETGESNRRELKALEMSEAITFRLRKSSSIKTALERIMQIPDMVWIECVSPDKTEPESEVEIWYMMGVKPSAVEQVVKKLQQDPDVEFAHEALKGEPF